MNFYQAECPPTDSVPVMYDEETFMCTRKWIGPGDDDPIQECQIVTKFEIKTKNAPLFII